MNSAILLIAHGSRRAEANADLEHVAIELRKRVPESNVLFAYLELASPSIPEGLQACVDQGARSIRILPYFLSAGSHVTDDLKRFRSEFLQKFPQTECTLCPPLGLHPDMIGVLLDRLTESMLS